MSESYPYPRFQTDGYELEVVEQEDAKNHPFLRTSIPSDADRSAVCPGDIVKLIFLYRDHVEKNGQTFTGEHMWVRITRCSSQCLYGQLDNDPQFSELLKADDEVRFHPKHIVQIWRDEENR